MGMFDQQRGPLLGNVAENDFWPTRCQDVWSVQINSTVSQKCTCRSRVCQQP